MSHPPTDAQQIAASKKIAPNRTAEPNQPRSSQGSEWVRAARQLKFTHLSTEHGLSQSTVLCALQDQQGFMWFGTQDGLNRFDGYRRVFVGCDGWSGVKSFDRQTGKFLRFVNDPAVAENRRLNIVNTLYADGTDTLWLGTSLGLSEFNLHSHEVRRYAHDPNDAQSLSHNRVQSITEDRRGTLWLGTPNGLNSFDRASGRITRFHHNPANSDSLANNDVQRIHVDNHEGLWLGTSGGLDRFNPETGRFAHNVSEERDHSPVRIDLKDK